MPGASPSPAAQPTTWAMAASPANSCSSSSTMEVNSVFCGNNAEAGSSPAEGIRSTLTTQESVRALCDKFGIPADYAPSCAGGDGRACTAPPHLKSAICVYEDALDAGMRVPLHPFYSKLLRHYGLAPSQLTPNAWRYMAAFVVLCSDLRLKPRLSVFRHFFTICNYKNKERAGGWHFFKPHKVSEYDRRRGLFSTTSSLLPKNDGWKERFFFLLSPSTTTWPCPVNWGKLTPDAAGDPKLSSKAQEVIEKLYNKQGSECIDLMSLLAEDKLAAALAPATPLKMEASSGRTGPTTPNVKSPNIVASHVTPPAGSMTSDQLLSSAVKANGDDWLRTVLNKTADVLIKESTLLRQQLSEARKSEAAAKAEVVKARKSEMAIKTELGKARKSKAAAKVEVNKRRKSEAAAKAQLSEARKSEAAAKAEFIATKAKLEEITKSEVATKASLEDMKKSAVVAAKAELAAAKAKVKKMGNEYFEDFVRLHNLMMDSIESSFDMVSKSASQPGIGNPEQTQHEGGSGSLLG